MKCTNCGKNDVNFYYESNVNGHITRQQLCSECAQKLGFGTDTLWGETQSMFDNMLGEFADLFGTRRRLFPFGGMSLPTMLMPRLAMPETQTEQHECSCGGCHTAEQATPAEQTSPDADGEMNARRQINMLRAQMYEAVKAEEFEKAAELRDKIRELEK